MPKRMRHFVSDIDVYLTQFTNTTPPSASQLAEINKYRRIRRLRDQPRDEQKTTQDTTK